MHPKNPTNKPSPLGDGKLNHSNKEMIDEIEAEEKLRDFCEKYLEDGKSRKTTSRDLIIPWPYQFNPSPLSEEEEAKLGRRIKLYKLFKSQVKPIEIRLEEENNWYS
ncbi:MAG: hypothetical protein ABIH72_02675 [archaeon]